MTRARTDIHPFDQQQPRAPVPRIMARQDRGTDMSDANKVEMLKKSKTVKNTELDIPAIEAGEKCNPLLINKPPPSVSGLRAVETEVSPATAAAKIAPITVGNPRAAASLAIDQEHLEEYADPDAKSSVVECRRPPKGSLLHRAQGAREAVERPRLLLRARNRGA